MAKRWRSDGEAMAKRRRSDGEAMAKRWRSEAQVTLILVNGKGLG